MNFPSKKRLRDSGIVFSGMVLLLFVAVPYILHREIRFIPIFISFLTTSLSIFSPYSLRQAYNLWIKLGLILGKVNSTIILGIFFYLLILPASIIKRLIKKLSFSRNKSKTYYNIQESSSSLRDQF